jgi:hypothetical protein
MQKFKILNNEKIELTTEELAQKELDEQNHIVFQQQQEQARQAKETKKASAKSKLLALGLTEEEIKLTFGV